MRNITPGEILSLREMLQMEANALVKAKAVQATITDPELKAQAEAGILAAEARIRGIQQFITENDIVSIAEVQ
jgi:hypothetical protein